MKVWQFEAAWTGKEWLTPAFAVIDDHGLLKSLSSKDPQLSKPEVVAGWLIPGWQNAHSHIFQYAMAGMTEHLPLQAGNDDFWAWRETMYELALTITPEKMHAIAKRGYAAMKKCGVTSVSEFHYLHHDPQGNPYANKAEMAERIMAAASEVGMQLCMVPVFYQTSNFGKPASERQKRFIFKSRDEYFLLVEAIRKIAPRYNSTVGMGVHSLRAASAEDAKAILDANKNEGPLHIHVAEQQKEVVDCEKFYGRRPVEWLLENCELGPRHNLVHATHMTEQETDRLAKSGATVVICPSTEGNSGDGFFPFQRYWQKNGRWALGSDSHISVNLAEDLRWLDYGQRLQQQKRNPLCRKLGEDSAVVGMTEAWKRGRLAAGLSDQEFFAIGQPFSGVVLDSKHDYFVDKTVDQRLAAYVYAGDINTHLMTI